MAVLDVFDEMAMRVSMGHAADTINKALSDRVYSSRIVKGPPGWYFRTPTSAFGKLKPRAKFLVRDPLFSEYGETDVSRYYPSIDIDRLREILFSLIGDNRRISQVVEWFSVWQGRDGLSGIPIGPDVSAVFGNAYLAELDDDLYIPGLEALRYTDDFHVVVSSTSPLTWIETIQVIDNRLTMLRLNRNIDKTRTTDDPDVAIGWIADSEIDYLATSGGRGTLNLPAVKELFDQETDATHPSANRVGYCLKVLGSQGSDHAIDALLRRPDLCDLNPVATGDYFAGAADEGHSSARDAIAQLLDRPPTPRQQGAYLHLLRTAARYRWGQDEGDLFSRIAGDRSLSIPVKGWALQAAAKTPAFSAEMATDIAAESTTPLARAALLAQRHVSGYQRGRRLAHITQRQPDLRATCEWVDIH